MNKERKPKTAFWHRKHSGESDGANRQENMELGFEEAESRAGRKEGGRREKGNGLKKDTFLRVGRVLLWGMLIFLFCKGVAASLRPDTAQEARQMIESFNRELERNKTVDSEISAFAQNFAREYLTYTAREEQEYGERLRPYMGKNTPAAAQLSSGTVKAVYTQAYRMEKYSENQWDVYVMADVKYTAAALEDGQTYREKEEQGKTFLKVPVCLDKSTGCMIVEEIPLFVNDSQLYQEYTRQEYTGKPLDEMASNEVKVAVSNFLKAYCEQDETVIGYYLAQGADKSQFLGLDGRYQFAGLEAAKCYQEQEGAEVVCIAEYTLLDSINQAKLPQRMNLQILKGPDGKYYIKSIHTRTGSLNLKK